MLYSTHPIYPQVYGEDELDWDTELETSEEHHGSDEYEASFDTNIDYELYSLRKGW